jgi:hypothetical protein
LSTDIDRGIGSRSNAENTSIVAIDPSALMTASRTVEWASFAQIGLFPPGRQPIVAPPAGRVGDPRCDFVTSDRPVLAAPARAAHRVRAAVARLTVICLVLASGVGILLPATPAAADGTPDISLSKTAPGSALVGEPVTYTLTVMNPAGAVPAYNLAFA